MPVGNADRPGFLMGDLDDQCILCRSYFTLDRAPHLLIHPLVPHNCTVRYCRICMDNIEENIHACPQCGVVLPHEGRRFVPVRASWFQIMYQRMYAQQVQAALPRAIDPARVGLPQAVLRNLERRELGRAEQIDDGPQPDQQEQIVNMPQPGHAQRVNDL